MTGDKGRLDELCINTIRMLAVDMVEAARSGHPGLPLGAAAFAHVLWSRVLHHSPGNPTWVNRDRFVLSAGHGSALLYALLHLTGYPLPLEEMKRFRQWESKTPGHPEYGLTPGVESTSGPLGQGVAMGVGMALAERFLAETFNRPGFPVVDHHTYALVSDGDLMEGVASEAASLAGTLQLGKIVYLYDDNSITIDGPTSISFREDVGKRFEAYGWHVQRVEDDSDLDRIESAIETARQVNEKPSLIMIKTHIGYGSPRQDTPKAHGEPLGPEGTQQTRERLGWSEEGTFQVPAAVRQFFDGLAAEGRKKEEAWAEMFERYRASFPEEAERFGRQMKGDLPQGWEKGVPVFKEADGPMATRAASGKVLNALADHVPNLLGGSADLAGSNKTALAKHEDRNIHFGVREHGMAAIANGMALHGGLIPYAATFLVFSDYMRPSIRLAALMEIRSIFVFSHDSIGVGEDGPTHQPVEHMAALRSIPNLAVMRPADANETAAAWRIAVSRKSPTALLTTRQKLPVLDPGTYHAVAGGVDRGAYVLQDCEGEAQLLLLAVGSEVTLALQARERLAEEGIRARVVSMPCWELFEAQDQAYRDSVLPPACKARLAIEAGCSMGWHRWVGDRGAIIAMDWFGASAPGGVLMEKFGFTVDNVLARARELLG